jgi:type IV secretion system protein VirD4
LLCYEELGELSLQNIINLISQPQKDIYDFLCERGKDKRYFSYLSNFSMDEQATIYYATFVSSVNKFNVQSVLDKTNCSTINFDDFIKQKTVIYVKMNRINPESFENDIAKILMQSLYKKLSAHAETTKNGCLDIPFIFLCDEFANVGKINFAPKIFSLSRSENISIICFIQGISQLKEIYGENQLQEMFDSTMCFFILKLTDTKFAQQLSSLFGRKLERIESKSKGAGGENKSESVTTQQQLIEQIRYEDLINKSRNEVIIIPEGVLAIKLKFQFMHERK